MHLFAVKMWLVGITFFIVRRKVLLGHFFGRIQRRIECFTRMVGKALA